MFHKMTPEQWYAVINTNLNSLFNMTRPVIEGMRERGFGRIINISSVNGQKGQMGQVNYSASKAGDLGFTKALAQENSRGPCMALPWEATPSGAVAAICDPAVIACLHGDDHAEHGIVVGCESRSAAEAWLDQMTVILGRPEVDPPARIIPCRLAVRRLPVLDRKTKGPEFSPPFWATLGETRDWCGRCDLETQHRQVGGLASDVRPTGPPPHGPPPHGPPPARPRRPSPTNNALSFDITSSIVKSHR